MSDILRMLMAGPEARAQRSYREGWERIFEPQPEPMLEVFETHLADLDPFPESHEDWLERELDEAQARIAELEAEQKIMTEALMVQLWAIEHPNTPSCESMAERRRIIRAALDLKQEKPHEAALPPEESSSPRQASHAGEGSQPSQADGPGGGAPQAAEAADGPAHARRD